MEQFLHISKLTSYQAQSLMMHSAVLAPPSVSTWSASQSQPMLYNPYGLHSIRQSRIRTLNLTWAQALTQKIVCVSFWDETVSFNSSGQGHPSIISIYWGKQWCVWVLSQCWCTMFTQNTILDIVDILARGRLCFLCLWAESLRSICLWGRKCSRLYPSSPP